MHTFDSARTRAHALGLAALLALGALAPDTASAQDFQWRGRLQAGRTLEVRGVQGGIRALPADGDEIRVVATKSARSSDPEEVEIEVLEHGDGVTICAVYPSRRGDRPNECVPGGGRMNTRRNDVRVDFTLYVPRGIRLVAATVNGEVAVERLQSDVVASTVNGNVNVATSGLVEARTVNGSIQATLGRADWSGGLAFETVNGGISLELPADLNAEVRASTVNGAISTDFPLTVQGRFGRHRIRGTVGSGGRELSLHTVNGSIHLRRST